MRRNRQFRAGDIMMILDVKRDFLMPIFRALELAGYLELQSGTELFRDRNYKFIKNTGIRSPSILKKPCDIVKDENTGELYVLDGNHPVQITDKLKLLEAMHKKNMLSEDIARKAGMHKYSVKSIRYLSEFIQYGIIERLMRTKENQKFSTYRINTVKRDEMIQKLRGAA